MTISGEYVPIKMGLCSVISIDAQTVWSKTENVGLSVSMWQDHFTHTDKME